jgi:quercetin dioxygenase-like cupin family protein
MAGQNVTDGIIRRYVTASRVTLAHFIMSQGSVVPVHSHENEQVSYVISGALRFVVGGQEVDVRGGSVLHIPPGVPHGVTVLEPSEVIDVFSPVRQDWIDGTDTYFAGSR